MTAQQRLAQIAKLSGRAAFKGVSATAWATDKGMKLTDTLLSPANGLANHFSGYDGKTPIKDTSLQAVKGGIGAVRKLAVWGDKKLRA